HADGETGLLIDAFNRMMAEIRVRDQALEGSRQTLEMKVAERTRQLKTAKEVAEVANRAKSDFLATMTHEIRTPMNGLMVMAELLNAANLGPRQQRYAEIVLKSGQGLLSIINDLLDLSKIEAGKLDLEKIPVDPTAIADDVVGLFWEHAAGKGLDLAARSSPTVPRKVLADPVRLNQILTNLTNNALKFTETGQVLISLHFEAGRLVISVADSGIGIRREKIDRLFEAFTQADQSTTRRYGGTGLGLTICRRLVDAMGGVITVQSEFGKGSIFRVSIPVDIAEPARPAAASGGLRATVIGGGKATVSALGTALLGRGFEVALAVNSVAPDLLFCIPEEAASWRSAVGADRRIVSISRRGDAAGDAAVMAGVADGVLVLPFCHR
ncbi:MAG: hybrid sensor histidine kinase/response regulator, partial [Alphaproteobacteria bacterium]|nr:hybrid sensor histidine kinase/response regulator [Alphaproteobacteria bacterium]